MFTEKYKEQLKKLAKEIQECKKIDGAYKDYSVEARLVAIGMIEKWFSEIFASDYDLNSYTEVDLYNDLNKKHKDSPKETPYDY